MKKETLLNSTTLYKGNILTLKRDIVRTSSGQEAPREIVLHSDAVGILAVQNDQVLLIQQYRHAIEKILTEIPAGLMESGETPIETARRELQEETGYLAHKLTPLCKGVLSPGFCNETIHIFLATDLEFKGIQLDEDEEIEVLKTPIQTFADWVQKGEIVDAKTVLAYYAYAHNHR